ncbi:hypothetical protein Tco_1124156 [Tanacetum coccineum]|uniref:Reverse transcriptase domain-containing protein n=1 Tax=Tanacetum coccineum TaxID=301880 RepID=A0ABQ5J600_9ASTR
MVNDHFNAESSLIESVLNRDNVISSPKIDFFLEEFAGELALIAPIPPEFVEADFDPKGDIRFIGNLMYDNSFPRPPETLKDDPKTFIDSNNDYSSSDNDSLYNDDIDYVEASPPDPSLEVSGDVLSGRLEGIAHIPPFNLDSDFTLSNDSLGSGLEVSFPSGSRNKIFDPGIFHEGFKAFQLISESPMIISGGANDYVKDGQNGTDTFVIPNLDVFISSFLSSLDQLRLPDFETHAVVFVLSTLDLYISASFWES